MNQRQCVILQGSRDWCRMASETLLEGYELGQTLWLVDNAPERAVSTSQKKYQSQLGKEFDAVVFNGLDEFSPDSFGAIVGTVKQGGVIVIWLDKSIPSSLFMQRFQHVISEFEQQHEHVYIVQQDHALPILLPPITTQDDIEIVLTDDQHNAVNAILKVVHGHRRRPLVLSADRGRGKSASLGIAAAQLLREGKQSIIITAPSLATVATVFEHAKRLLPDATTSTGLLSLDSAEIRFVAPDVLIESELKVDLVLVDEAAAIPASMLDKLLGKYSRLVFSTTLHGYEGTGRGFAVRFQKTLEECTPNWHHYRMETPIRWGDDDTLEAFSFKALLLNSEPVDDALISDARADRCSFEHVERQALVNNEQDLSELFGLMVLAHYRTRPSDLQMMLDREDVSVYVMRYKGHIVASAWLVEEGQLDAKLSAAIYAGERRLKGHLLPQSLLAHSGVFNAGSLKYQRVIRIATHPAVQQHGVGKALLNKIIAQTECDLVGASFASSTDIINFWAQSGFYPVRLGLHKDDVSGCHSVMMLKAASSKGQELLSTTIDRFQQHWPQLLLSQFSQLDTDLVVKISQLLPTLKAEITLCDRQETHAFANGQRGYEFSQISLWNYLHQQIHNHHFLQLSQQQQDLCIKSILQQHAWTDIAKKSAFSGKGQTMNALREAVRDLLVLTD